MGYTNWMRYPQPTMEQAASICDDIEALIANSDVSIDVTRGPGQIKLNGVRRGSAEDFLWPMNALAADEPPSDELTHDWFKTYRRRYDAVVFAAMMAVKYHLPETELSTDDTFEIDRLRELVQDRDSWSDFRSIVHAAVTIKANEFSPQHRAAVALHCKTFRDRDPGPLVPGQPVT